MRHITLFFAVLFSLGRLQAQAPETARHLILNSGAQANHERDFGYSPLAYRGAAPAYTLGFSAQQEHQLDEVYIHLSKHRLTNAYDAEMNGFQLTILTYTFYETNWLPKGMSLGWSNSNEVSVRNFADAQNYNPRFDSHTAFGAALRYERPITPESRWRYVGQGHLQLIGFTFLASVVTSPPDAFFHESNTFNAFLQSINLFQPFNQHDFGMLHRMVYSLNNGNELAFGYRFNYTSLEDAHRSQRTSGHYFFQLNFRL